MRVFVILPAAGIGTRMSSGSGAVPSLAIPKQFLSLHGVPVIVHGLRAFVAVTRVEAAFVAVRAPEIDRVAALVAEFGLGAKVHVVEGGENRQQSVGNALTQLIARTGCAPDDIVLVHDAARPLIDSATIERTIDAVIEHGAAIVGLPAVDTIKQVERTAHGAIITATIPASASSRPRPRKAPAATSSNAPSPKPKPTSSPAPTKPASSNAPAPQSRSSPARPATSKLPSRAISNWRSSTCERKKQRLNTDFHRKHRSYRRR